MRRTAALAATALALAAACLWPDENISSRYPGVIQDANGLLPISLPDTVRAAQSFNVRITTEGGGCARADSGETVVSGRLALVTPFDVDPSRSDKSTVCPAIVKFMPRDVSLRLDSLGVTTVRVMGTRAADGEIVTVDRDVVAR